MPQVFSPRSDRRLRLALSIGAAMLLLILAVGFAYARSGAAWAVGKPAAQPIPFSHAVHAGGLGLDCRFCHAGVEQAAAAGMPTAETCLGCHSRVWTVTPQFAPLATALARGTPVEWSSVHRLPDHVRFHHAAHVRSGVTCQTCHGPVWEMPRTVKTETLSMGWCLDCHRDPASRQGPADQALARDPAGGPPPDRPFGLAARPVMHQGIEVSPLTRCSTCHR
ncbi:cytochrome c3 family protein [Paeniroseomonas aquatica]|uniref:Cytochrome c3 family protein n=1 Tax=Paeniroseomonas aquatica TaxID=373043 RepID=A0ABT8A338_9PROT|nr:cytochrome c3 family protein [Paeniroseomonas aquatica]MDN3564197.1 cytochrome c3 family protein [Paeniroseomonas aquatica]